MDGIERWMAAAEGTALIFVLFNSYNVANDDSSQTLSEEIEKKSSSLMEMIVLCPDLLVEAIIRTVSYTHLTLPTTPYV